MLAGVGTDIVEIDRIKNAFDQRSRFIEKYFTKREADYFEERRWNASTVAGYFAAKESVAKALGSGFRSFAMKDVEILKDSLGKPSVVLHQKAKERAEQIGVRDVLISISHCRDYAVAYATAIG